MGRLKEDRNHTWSEKVTAQVLGGTKVDQKKSSCGQRGGGTALDEKGNHTGTPSNMSSTAGGEIALQI